MLGLADDPDHARYIWTPAKASPDVQPREKRLLLAIAERDRWREQLRQAQTEAAGTTTTDVSATKPAA